MAGGLAIGTKYNCGNEAAHRYAPSRTSLPFQSGAFVHSSHHRACGCPQHQLPHAYSDCHIRQCVMQTGHTITIALVSCATAVHRYHYLAKGYPGVRGHGLLYDTCTGPWHRHNTPNSGSAAVVHNLICNWEGFRSPLQCLIIAVGTQAVRCDALGRRSWPRGEEKLEDPSVCHQLSHMPLQPRALH